MKPEEALPVSRMPVVREEVSREQSQGAGLVMAVSLALVVGGLYLVSLYSYLLFHSLAEMFSVIVSVCIFMVIFNTRRVMENDYFQFIGVAYLFVGILTMFHLLAYKGMGVFPGYDANLPTQLWIASRYMLSLSFFAAPWFLGRKRWFAPSIAGYSVVTVLLLLTIFGRVFPDSYIEGMGLTPFKVVSEYVIAGFFTASVFLLGSRRDEFDRTALYTLAASLIVATMSELAFTSYVGVYDAANLIGHLLLVVAVYLSYRAIIQASLTKPYETLFSKLNQNEKALRRAKEDLEARVMQRTEELARANQTVERELSELKETRAAREASDARLHLMLEQVPCVLWTTDRSLTVTMAAGAGLRKVPSSLDSIVGITVSRYYRTDDPDAPPLAAHRRALSGTPADYELEHRGNYWRCYVEPLRSPPGEVSGVIGVAIDVTDIRRTEAELRAVSRRLVEIQEDERRALAEELHDHIGQSLAGLKLLMARPVASTVDNGDRVVLNEAQSLVSELMKQVRGISLDLRPTMLDDLGLLPALLWHIQGYTERTGVKVNFKHGGLDRKFPADTATAVYRVVQEGLSNVARHADVGEVDVSCDASEDRIAVAIEDRGTGFDPSGLTRTAGLDVMRERVRMLDGELTAWSAPGKGTRVTAELPLGTQE